MQNYKVHAFVISMEFSAVNRRCPSSETPLGPGAKNDGCFCRLQWQLKSSQSQLKAKRMCGFGIREKNLMRFAVFWCISVRFCSFQTSLMPPPYSICRWEISLDNAMFSGLLAAAGPVGNFASSWPIFRHCFVWEENWSLNFSVTVWSPSDL